MTREEMRVLWQQYIKTVYENDHNNTCFDCYNEYCDKQGKENLVDCKENVDVIVNDIGYIDYCVDNTISCGDINNIIEELKMYNSIDKLYDMCCESIGCCGDYDVQIIDGEVWMIDLSQKIVEHKDGSTTVYSAALMTEDDFCYDEENERYWMCDNGTEYKITINKEGKIVKKIKRKEVA